MHIHPQSIEIERIYSQVLADGKRAIAITSANPGEGVTSITLALAQRNLLSGNSTLVVDLNLRHPAFNGLLNLTSSVSQVELLDDPQLITAQGQPAALLGIPAPVRREAIMKLRKPGILEECIARWQQDFDTIIFDTSPVNHINANNIPPERVAAACGAGILVVLAGQTTEAMVFNAAKAMRTAGAKLIGCVMNDRDNPLLKNELLREVDRIDSRFSGISRRLGQWINQSNLLSLEI